MTTSPLFINSGGGNFHFEVTCPVQRPLLNILRRFVTSVAEEMGFNPDDVLKIEMAVDEACSNAFLHAYDNTKERDLGGIQMKLNIGPESLTIQIEDKGCGIDEKRLLGLRSLQSYQQSEQESYHGLGILIMKEFMDDVQFDGDENRGTLVTLKKFLKPQDPHTSKEQAKAT